MINFFMFFLLCFFMVTFIKLRILLIFNAFFLFIGSMVLHDMSPHYSWKVASFVLWMWGIGAIVRILMLSNQGVERGGSE